ncbi:MAG: hypothetical protein MRERV_2c070 [Mycoplasmataceae bacterium RV_VA103A]|nr:MAG: hypothetical protein MRERV_2c070 [Mycoplasmataceae bacterium RV_VA103A]
MAAAKIVKIEVWTDHQEKKRRRWKWKGISVRKKATIIPNKCKENMKESRNIFFCFLSIN